MGAGEIASGAAETDAHVMTVCGAVAPEAIGYTLIHEHLLIDLAATFSPQIVPEHLRKLIDTPVSDVVLPLLRHWPVSLSRDNVVLDDEQLAVRELDLFARAGGRALVDCTVVGIGRNPEAVRRISRATGVHVVHGTGFYVEASHPPWLKELPADAIYDFFLEELRHGIDGTDVRAGVIGEIGTSGVDGNTRKKTGDVTLEEERVLRAAAAAAVTSGCSVIVHLDPRGTGAFEVFRILDSEGLSAERMVMAHMDANPLPEYHEEVAALGCYLAFDHFGREYYAGHFGRPYPTDAQRLALLCTLLEAGYEDRLVISQDVCMKIDLHHHGGGGYDHVLKQIEPLLGHLGVSDVVRRKLLIDNPRRVLTITPRTSQADKSGD